MIQHNKMHSLVFLTFMLIQLATRNVYCNPLGEDDLLPQHDELATQVTDNDDDPEAIPGETLSQLSFGPAINYLADEERFSEFGKLLERRGDPEEVAMKPTNSELDSFTKSLVMVRNQLAMFTGKMGREAFETKVRGVAADMYLNLMEALVPSPNKPKRPNFVITTILNTAASLMHWSEETIQLEMPGNKELSARLEEAQKIVQNLSARLMMGRSFSSQEKDSLLKAVKQIEEIQKEMLKPNMFKLNELCQAVTSRVGEILSKISEDSYVNDNNPMDAITKYVDSIGDLLTITWERKNPFKRVVKTLLLGLVRTNVPKLKQLTSFIDMMARQTHERLSHAEYFPEHMLYLLE